MTQPESRLQRRIQAALRDAGAFVFKVHGSEYMMSGLPDLVVCYKGKFIALEVKTATGKASAIQKLRIYQIRDAGGMAYIVRTVDDALAVLALADRDKARPTQSETS